MPKPKPGIRTLLLVPMALLVAVALLLAALLGYRHGERTADVLVGQVVAESAAGLRNHLRGYLEQAQLATGVGAEAMRLGSLDPVALFGQPEPWFLAQHRLFPGLDDLYFGRSDGAIVGMDKAGGQLLLKLTTAFPQRSFFLVDPNGQRGKLLRTESYDASTRDWYRTAVLASGPVWSPVYVLLNKDTLGITASRPALDRSGRMAGVMGANLTLGSISEYLKSRPVGGQAVAYVVDGDGALVATSSPDTPLALRALGKPASRVKAGESSHPVIAASHLALQQARGSAPSARPLAVDASVQGVRYRVHQSSLKDDIGLDWHLVCVVDPEHHLADVKATARTTLLIGAVLLVALLGVVVVVTQRLSVPIQSLGQATQRIAQGHYGQTLAQVGGGREMGQLVDAFNRMSEALHQAIGKVVSHATQLEVQVANRTAELSAANQALERSRAEAQAASEAKTRFMAQLSHEIRNPLSAIAGTCYLMRQDSLSPTLDQRVAALEASSQHLLGVVNSVLDFAKIEAGRFQLEPGPLWVQALVANVVSMLSGPAAAKGLSLHADVGPMPEGLVGDRIRLQQMLLNYAANAVKFTETGRITLAARVLAASGDDALLRFEVCDGAPAIAPEMRPRLFKPFEQGPLGSTRHPASSGLGLAITRQMAQLMGGTADVEAAPGGGNLFFFTARLARQAPHESPASPPRSRQDAEGALRRDFAGARVLVAEDDALNRMITRTMLENVGLVVDAAASGAQAVRLAAEHDFALILMDMQMPDLDGLGAARQIRQLARHARTPIVATTANTFAQDRHSCLLAGMDDFLSKPLDAGEFFVTVHRWLARG